VLTDNELLAGTSYWRKRLDAEGLHAGASAQIMRVVTRFERELSARFGGTTTVAAALEHRPAPASWWKRH
jgi:hypothetical protein